MGPDPSVTGSAQTYGELAAWLEPYALGTAIDVNNIVYQKIANVLTPITKGHAVPVSKTAAYTCKLGDMVSLAAGGLPTLPPLLATGTEFSETPPAQPGQEVAIVNTTGAAINVATNAGASINGAAVGTAYSLAAGASKRFVLDTTGTNWMVF